MSFWQQQQQQYHSYGTHVSKEVAHGDNNIPVATIAEQTPFHHGGYESGSFYKPSYPSVPYVATSTNAHYQDPTQSQMHLYQTSYERGPQLQYEHDASPQRGWNDYTFPVYQDNGIDLRTRTLSIHSAGSTSTLSTTTSSSTGSASSPQIHRVRGLQPSPHPYLAYDTDPYSAMGHSPSSFPAYSPPNSANQATIVDTQFNQAEYLMPPPDASKNSNYANNVGPYQPPPPSSLIVPRSSHPIPIPTSTALQSGAPSYRIPQRRGNEAHDIQRYRHEANYPPPQHGHSLTLVDQHHAPLTGEPVPPVSPINVQVSHPYSQYNKDFIPVVTIQNMEMKRKPWPSKFEDQIFTPEDLKLPAVKRRRIYINSLENHCNQIHSLLKAHGLLTAPAPQPIQEIVAQTVPQDQSEGEDETMPSSQPKAVKGKQPRRRGQQTKLTLVKLQHEIDSLRNRLASLTESICKQSNSPERTEAIPAVALSPHPFSTAPAA